MPNQLPVLYEHPDGQLRLNPPALRPVSNPLTAQTSYSSLSAFNTPLPLETASAAPSWQPLGNDFGGNGRQLNYHYHFHTRREREAKAEMEKAAESKALNIVQSMNKI